MSDANNRLQSWALGRAVAVAVLVSETFLLRFSEGAHISRGFPQFLQQIRLPGSVLIGYRHVATSRLQRAT
jgi:hypothetical protein